MQVVKRKRWNRSLRVSSWGVMSRWPDKTPSSKPTPGDRIHNCVTRLSSLAEQYISSTEKRTTAWHKIRCSHTSRTKIFKTKLYRTDFLTLAKHLDAVCQDHNKQVLTLVPDHEEQINRIHAAEKVANKIGIGSDRIRSDRIAKTMSEWTTTTLAGLKLSYYRRRMQHALQGPWRVCTKRMVSLTVTVRTDNGPLFSQFCSIWGFSRAPRNSSEERNSVLAPEQR